MIAVDTNILVRLLTGDDPSQAKRAARVIKSDDIFIPKTVLLETEWVLRHAYEVGQEAIMGGFRKLLGLSNVTVEDSAVVAQSLTWCESGFDFADALHLASSMKADKFATFDKAFAKNASKFKKVKILRP